MSTNSAKQTTTAAAPQGLKPHRRIKLGIDVHWQQYTVVRQIDDAVPQPPQRFTPEAFVAWAARQCQLADAVHSCYEAGAFGYVLHRRLERLGVHNVVVRPRNWDEYGRKVKTDRRDALALVGCLDRFLAGNRQALTVIRIPGVEEERRRSVARQRESFGHERVRLAAQALSAARYYRYDLPAGWWRPKRFATTCTMLPEFLQQLLAPWQALLVAIEQRWEARTQALEAAQTRKLPTGLGAMTAEVLEREIGDWQRFQNRRQIASYTGLVPSEASSGGCERRGAITKHGNPRVRHLLIETVWRLYQFQPDYHAIRRRADALRTARAHRNSAAKKKLTVAIARQFAVDWWRRRTGRTTPEKLGLQMSWPAAYVSRKQALAASPTTTSQMT